VLKITKSKLRKIIKEEIELESLRNVIRKTVREMDFKDKGSFEKYKSQHKMRSGTKVNIAGKETTAGAASDKSQSGVLKQSDKEKEIEKILNTVWGEGGFEGTEDDTFEAVDLLRDKGIADEDIRSWLDIEFDASEQDLEYWMTGDEDVYDDDDDEDEEDW
jgi:hypothetical protein